MPGWLVQAWDRLRSSFWFVPLAMIAIACAAAFLLAEVDDRVSIASDGPLGWIKVNAATARSTLSLLSGAMITLAGVVFSLTMVTLSITASQFGSRLLRTAMMDFTTQFALGAFLSTAVFCLALQRFIPADADDSVFVPHLSVFFAYLLAAFSLVKMVWFVHHIGVSIQAQTVVSEVADELDSAVQRLYPERLGSKPSEEDAVDETLDFGSKQAESLPAKTEGYLQIVDVEALFSFAKNHDVIVQPLSRPGDFIIGETPLVKVLPREGAISFDREQATAEVNVAFITGRRRTPRQDVCCAVNELVEVAVRALSPGINDPFTAVTCIDRMTASLSRLLSRDLPKAHRHDGDGVLRVVAEPVAIRDVLDAAFTQIRHYGCSDVTVVLRMMESFEVLSRSTVRPEDREAVIDHAESLLHRTEACLQDNRDKQRVQAAFDRIRNGKAG